ncbi:DUF5658 family protein [Planococcus sp. N028]|uniref:DUF5658 family protein n=1 Tax=Planococcus shixiaomingii TaxID=3058393 RepID=A0ABT8N6C7_9BACL|nr:MULTISPECIES: DUF5658 family protein [unclassified Planococcus (in: firmicutes)]MDN7243435.1 DUF5658 family protein [Planococcus sp. N028]WKA55881.1 DUF5658 family protein [Planococcus sp. N022]
MIAVEQKTPLKNYIWVLIILNIFDGMLTYFGLALGVITEANPLLSSFSPISIFMIKMLLSLCLFGLLFTPFVFIQSDKWRFFLISTNALYFTILLLHFFWILLLLAS